MNKSYICSHLQKKFLKIIFLKNKWSEQFLDNLYGMSVKINSTCVDVVTYGFIK